MSIQKNCISTVEINILLIFKIKHEKTALVSTVDMQSFKWPNILFFKH
jgi:hypothetical protein